MLGIVFRHHRESALSIRHRPNLKREILIVLAVKLVALFVIWSVWFTHPQAPRLNAEAVKAALYSSPPPAQQGTSDAKP
jgi:hypothetical protein